MPATDSRLVAAVRERDAAAVGELLAAGSDPDALGEDGWPLLCAAVASYDVPVAEALVAGGADPYRRLPDGSTPLLRAVDGGCVAGVDALIDGTGPVTDAAVRAELLDRARQWHRTGTLAELRRRTGALADGSPFSQTCPYEQRALEIFLPWATQEEDPVVLCAVLNGLGDHNTPEVAAVGLSFLTHPAPGIRCMVPHTLELSGGRLLTAPEALEAVLTLARDADSDVRAVVCDWLAGYPGRTPDIADALACLLEHEDRMTRIRAVYGLAERDDPRCVAGYDLIGPVDRELHPGTWELDAVQRYERRLRGRARAEPLTAPCHPV